MRDKNIQAHDDYIDIINLPHHESKTRKKCRWRQEQHSSHRLPLLQVMTKR